jgi:hypothetical protein
MENSGKILFGDDTAQWYVAVGEDKMGPLKASEVYKKIESNEISWIHYIWKKGQAEWKRISDVKTFQMLMPQPPPPSIPKETSKPIVKKTTRASQASPAPTPPQKNPADARCWYLHYQDSQFGPFSQKEIQHSLKVGKLNGRIHAWKQGMKTWERLERIEPFKDNISSPPSMPSLPQANKKLADTFHVESRKNPRRPLVAKILISDEQSVIVGVCRDISVGGLQVLTDKVPGKVGARFKMNISPSSDNSENPIEPFVAEGVIVRILEDGRGFSFRFDRISGKSKLAIESYINSTD